MSRFESRNIRVFISSTFNDMKEERDELVSKVFPLLRKKAQERQVSLTEIDLRWGITEKQSQESKVVQICLEEIDRSRPFFIGLLGGRYGWCPSNENVDWHKVISDSYSDAIEDLYNGMSMTELEIRHGIFRNNEGQHAAFYLRDMPGEEIEPRQKELREMVSAQTRFPVHTYKSIKELVDLIIKDFSELLDKYYPEESCNTWEALNAQHYSYLERSLRYYVPIPKIETSISLFYNQTDKKGLIITGDSGIGKSTILAKIATDLYVNEDYDVLSFFPANSANGSSFNDMADWFCRGFESLYGFDYNRDTSHISELQRAASILKPDKKLILIIDGINQIVSSNDVKNDFVWWPVWDDNVYVIFSTPENTEIAQNLKRFGYDSLHIGQLNLDQRVQLSYNYLKRDFNKSLSPEQLEYIGQANPLLNNTLLFVSLLDELRKFGSYEELTNELSLMTSFKNVVEFFEFVINKQRNLFSSKQQYESVLSAIAVSYKGLSENTLISLTGISRLDLSTILGINDLNFTMRESRISFAHDAFRNAVTNVLLNDIEKEKSLRREIINFYNQDKKDQDESWEELANTILDNNIDNDESLFELLFQYYNLEEYDDLFIHLSKMQTYNKFSSSGKLNELGFYCTKLISVNHFMYDFLSIIFNEMATTGSEAMLLGAMFYIVIMTQSENIINLSNFISIHMRSPEPGKRLLLALIKMLENEHEENYEHLRNVAEQNVAAANMIQGDIISAMYQSMHSFNDSVDMSDPSIANIGELLLSLYEKSGNKTYLSLAQDIHKEVLAARIRKYNTEDHEDVAVAYANYAAALSDNNHEYSLELQQKSLSIFERIKGHYHIDVAIQYHNIAQEMIEKDTFKATEFSETALEIYQKLLGENAIETMDEHRALAIIFREQGEYDKSWVHCLTISDYMCSEPERKHTFINLLRMLLSGFYFNKDYEKAEEIGLYALSIMESNDLLSIDFHDNLGKVYHVKGMTTESEFHYNKAFEIACTNKLYEKGLQSLIYLSHIYFDEGDIDKAQLTLNRIIEITDENNLGDSLMLAYAYYNLGIIMYTQHGNQDEIIKMIERAISIREKLVDEEEDDLEEYRNTLKHLQQECKHTEIDETGENSRHAIEEMANILDGSNPDALDAFTQGMTAFDTGNMDNALHKLEIAESYLDKNADVSAYAQIERYLAYCNELLYTRSNKKNENPTQIFNRYDNAINLAQSDSNYPLAKEICHDAAMFCYSLGEYQLSEVCHWREFENLLASDRFITLDAAITLYNIIMTIYKQEPSDLDYDTLSALTALALYIYRQCSETNEQLRSSLENGINKIMDSIGSIDDSQIDHWGYNVWLLFKHVKTVEHLECSKLECLLLKLSIDYYRMGEDKESLAFFLLNYVLSLYNLPNYSYAIQEAELLITQYKQYLIPENIKNAETLYYMVYLAVHDFIKAESIRKTYSISDDIVNKYMDAFTPCYFALLNNDEDEAERIYSDLLALQNKRKLSESQYYDLALYCGHNHMPYESKEYMKLWLQCIENMTQGNNDYYQPAIATLTSLIEQ